MKKLIKNGIVVTANHTCEADVLIEDEKILAIGKFDEENENYCEVYDVSGMFVMPGLIDPHTHMELQQSEEYISCDDFYTGTVAAAVGGTTTIIDHIGFGPKGCNLHYSIENYHKKAEKAVIDYGFHGVFQHVDEDIIKELEGIVKNEGVMSFKAYSTYAYKLGDSDMLRILEAMKKYNGLLTCHCENDEITNYLRAFYINKGDTDAIYHALSRPNQTESESVDTMINLAAIAGDAPLYIVHTSTSEALDRIRLARTRGQKNLYCETCTQYLVLDDTSYYKDGNQNGLKYIMAPPLRSKLDIEILWKGIEDGTVNVIATDHCPFMIKEKLNGDDNFTKAPGGAPGVEERVRIIFSEGVMKGRINLNQFVEVMSTNAAKIFGMYPQKGSLVIGTDADIVVIDPTKEETLSNDNTKSRCDYCAYEGMKVNAGIHLVFSRGNLIAKDNEFLGRRGGGRFINRKLIN
ncbi:MAG: dihydropyrimidinase [Tissierellia bacterium]|nr:dihydropyrimidinase [Tissierellia bacterium]